MTSALVTAVTGAAAGVLATRVEVGVEGVVQPLAERVWPPTPEQRLIPGADAAHHGDLMPPTVVVKRVLTRLGRPIPDAKGVERCAAALHWSTGAGAGAAQALLRRRSPLARRALGLPAGLGLYALTHGSALPAFGVQPPPWRVPPAALTWEAGSHAVFGAVVELALRALARVARGAGGRS